MLPTFCRVTGNSRNLPKPNYFPLLPPISPVEARRICRLMGRSVPPEDHLYVPVIEYARPSKQSNCHITGLAPPDQHHYQPTNNATTSASSNAQCRITAKHQINEDYKYVFPMIQEPAKPLKKVLERMSSRSDITPDQRFVYKLEENSTGLVVSAEMEAAIRRGEIESLSVSKDATSLLIRLKDGPSLTLDLQPGSDEAAKASAVNALFDGAGQDQETLMKQVQIKQYKKRKISAGLSPTQSRPVSPCLMEPEVPVDANWDERITRLTSANRSASNLLVIGANWRELLYPNVEAWDWEALKTIPEVETPPKLGVHDMKPLDAPAARMAPGFVQSTQVPVLNEESTGLDAVPLYSEKLSPLTHDHLQTLPADYVRAVYRIETPDTPQGFKPITKLKEIFNDVDSLLYLPFVHEVAALVNEMATPAAVQHGYMVRTELDGIRFVTELDGLAGNALVIGGALVGVDEELKRFVVGRQTPVGFVPGKMVSGRFEPGFVVQNAEGASFLPGSIVNNRFAAGQLIRDTSSKDDAARFVTGQVVQTLLGPKFVPGRTILTQQGPKFVAGQTDTKTGKFHSGQIMQTDKGPVFVPGVTFDTPQGARFIAGQVDESTGEFVPGQAAETDGQLSFVPGETLETSDGPIFLPGQSYVNKHGRIRFCPGRVASVSDVPTFVPGETMLPTPEGVQQFVSGVLAEERFVPCKFEDGVCVPAESEEQVFTVTGNWSDGLPIDGTTFTAMPRKKPDMGYMVQHEERIKFLPTEQSQDELLSGVDSAANIKIVPGQLLELGDTPKFVPGKKIESAVGSIFIPGQAVRTGPNRVEQFVPGQVIDGGKAGDSAAQDKGPTFCPGQMVNCETGKKFVPGQVFSGKSGPRFIPGKILMSPSGASTFIPGQVVYSCDRGSIFVPGNVVDTSKGPYFVPGRVIEQPNGAIKFVAGEIIETETGPHYVTPHETDIDLLDEADGAKEIVVQGFPVSPEELRLITAYPFAALHYPTREGERPVINSRMLRQMAAAGIAVSRLTNTNLASDPSLQSTLNDVIINAPREMDNDAILGADVNRDSEPTLVAKPKKEKKIKEPTPPVNNNEPKQPAVDDDASKASNANAPAAAADNVPEPVDAGPVEADKDLLQSDAGTDSSVPDGAGQTGNDSDADRATTGADDDSNSGTTTQDTNQLENTNDQQVPESIQQPQVPAAVVEEPVVVRAPPPPPPVVVLEPVQQPEPKPAVDDSNSRLGDDSNKVPAGESTGTKQDTVQKEPEPPQPPPPPPPPQTDKDAKNAQGQGSPPPPPPPVDQSKRNDIKEEPDKVAPAFQEVTFVSIASQPEPAPQEATEPPPPVVVVAQPQVPAPVDTEPGDGASAVAICTHCGIGSLVIQADDGTFVTTSGIAVSRSSSGLKLDRRPSLDPDALSNKIMNSMNDNNAANSQFNSNDAGGNRTENGLHSNNNDNDKLDDAAKNLISGRLAPDGQESNSHEQQQQQQQKNLEESYRDYSNSLRNLSESSSSKSTAGDSDSLNDGSLKDASSSHEQPKEETDKTSKKKRSKDHSKDAVDLTLKTDMKIEEASDSSTNQNAKPVRPSDMKGLVNGHSSPPSGITASSGASGTSPVSPVVDSSKLIDGWKYLHRATNGPQDADGSPTSPPPPPIEIDTQQATSASAKPRKFSRRVTSRSNSTRLQMNLELNLSEEDSLELEDEMDSNGKGIANEIPTVITSAKDISRDVIDTLRYSRDEKMKAYYTKKILEAVGLSIEQQANSSNSDNDNSDKSSGTRSRKTSAAGNASACIILKDFLQTIVPAEAAHGVLIGGIDYMVIDDEGVRYFESASGFASRRNSRYDIRQAARSRSSSHDPLEEAAGPWPWADVGPKQHRRMSIDEFRRKLHEQDSSAGTPQHFQPLSRSASSADVGIKASSVGLYPSSTSSSKVHGRHSVASLPVSRRSSGYTTPQELLMPSNKRRSSLVDDITYFPSPSNGGLSLPPSGIRKRKVAVVEPVVHLATPAPQQRRSLYSRSSFDTMDY